VSPKRLAGWEPQHRYRQTAPDQWVVEVEPEWDSEQVTLLLAARELQADIGAHGHPLTEAMSPDGDPANPRRKYHYEVPLPAVDFAAKALADAQDARRQQYPDATENGLMWGVKKVDDA
jgi:hypothetical protein